MHARNHVVSRSLPRGTISRVSSAVCFPRTRREVCSHSREERIIYLPLRTPVESRLPTPRRVEGRRPFLHPASSALARRYDTFRHTIPESVGFPVFMYTFFRQRANNYESPFFFLHPAIRVPAPEDRPRSFFLRRRLFAAEILYEFAMSHHPPK